MFLLPHAFHERCGIYEYFMTQVRDSGQRGQVQCSLPLEELDRRGDQLGLQLLPNKISPHLRLFARGKYIFCEIRLETLWS